MDDDVENVGYVDATVKRPIAVWGITLFYTLGLFGYITALTLIFKTDSPATHEFRRYYASTGVFSVIEACVGLLLTFGAVVSLFRLKRIALKLWLALIVLGIVSNAYHLLMDDLVWSHVEKSSANVLLSMFITIAIYLYARNLDVKGMLK